MTDPAAALPAFSAYGVELEYMIVDRETLDVRPMADELLRRAAGEEAAEVARGEMGWSNELALHVVEVKNRRPHPRLADLPGAFRDELAEIGTLLAPAGARLMPGGMHPWMDPRRESGLWTGEHADIYRSYDRIFGCRGHGWLNLQSMHLNLPFAGDAEFARLHAAVRLALPILPALAASSPFAEGRHAGALDQRLVAYRSHQARIPASMGALIPEPCASPADYRALVLAPLYCEIAPHDPEGMLRHEWLNARAAIPRFDRSAIEIRILDTQECPEADLAVAAATVALVHRFYESGAEWLQREGGLETPALVAILDACIRDADRAVIDDAHYLRALGQETGSVAAGELWARLLDGLAVEGRLDGLWLPALAHLLDKGPLARRILNAAGPEPSPARLRAVYGELCDCLQAGRLFDWGPRPAAAVQRR